VNRKSCCSAIACVLCVVLISCQARTPAHYLLKSGFVGWVRIDFNVAGAAPLVKESGAYLVRFDSSGHASTSSNPIDLLAQHRFSMGENEAGTELKESFWNGRTAFKETGTEGEPRIWGRGVIIEENGGRERVYERFFVGTKAQFADSIRGWTR
jgi:hypothetical protein